MQLSTERAEQGAEFESAERDGSPATAAARAAMRSTRRQSAVVQCIRTQTTIRAYSDCS
jgi:hypothetical protein